ncbi:FAD-dependent oxidoreductase [Geosporobacter ferrireducens]|uniref:(2Fe-2S)-binding protein n=1 Tax=Geosporobacter ferrireducens TaxID=1424294 RepID=A0A1D8GHE0_9FIRM|nr:FAD-dependent oxidoreductase [Geosporobacter ferrireducens]AOT70317.1 (2Fe-2S)-binding protein [Geosporobacter ferrireducens]MTI54285.1 FAD-dependent oxidoreductase [Geosporobacter ferrireducens]
MKKSALQEDSFSNPPQSYWIASTPQTDYAELREDSSVDVAIVGGGMVGITVGFLLKQEGLKVAVIEADRILQGTTGYTTAKLTSQHSLIYNKIAQQMGEEQARQYAEANGTAIRMVAELIKDQNIDCDFSWQPAFVYTQSEQYIQKIEDEVKTAAALGIKAFYQQEIPLPFPIKAAVRFEDQGQFHPRKYLLALAKKIPGEGSHIFEQTRAVDIEEGDLPAVISASGRKIYAKNIIIASHYPFYDKPGFYFAKIYQERSYVLAAKIKEPFPGGMYINAEQPTRSLRSLPYEGGELVMFIGDHHKTGQGENTLQHYLNLKHFAQEIYTVEDIPYRWSTQDCITMDGLPYVGRLTADKHNLFIATGFQKWGMTNSTVAAIILKDLILKGENPWTPVYDPARFTPAASAKNFIVENADVAAEFISGKLMPVPDRIDPQPGEGKIVEVNGQRAGAYKDEAGKVHLVDTTCTHLGCELQWNAAENSWDCPCHGSRYTYDGEIIEGPTVMPLKKIES